MIVLYIFGGLLALVVLYVLFLCICSLLVNTKKEYTHYSPFYHGVVHSLAAIILWFSRVRVHIAGAEKLPQHKRLLFVSNHLSNYDPIITWHVFRKWNMAYISKPSNFGIPIAGRLIHRCCFMPIDRENPRKAMTTILRAAQLLQSEEMSIGVYPEGTRSKTGVLLPFHNGVFKIAQRGNADVVVLSVTGTSEIHRTKILRRTHVYLEVLAVLPADQIKAQKTEQIGEEVRRLLLKKKEERT